jgi:hypothetical protein
VPDHLLENQWLYLTTVKCLKNMARPERFELPTLWFEDRRRTFCGCIDFFGFQLLLIEADAARPPGLVGIYWALRLPPPQNHLHLNVKQNCLTL